MNLHEHLKRRTRHTARAIIDGLEGRDACLNCGHSGCIEVHHIDGDMFNNHPMNLVPLCHRCHKAVHNMHNVNGRINAMRNDFEELIAD